MCRLNWGASQKKVANAAWNHSEFKMSDSRGGFVSLLFTMPYRNPILLSLRISIKESEKIEIEKW